MADKTIYQLALRVIVVILAALLSVAVSCDHSTQGNRLPIIGITQIATHPALDEVRAGLISGSAG